MSSVLADEIKERKRDIISLENELEYKKDVLLAKITKLQQTCTHTWVKDICSYDHRTHYTCDKCDIYE